IDPSTIVDLAPYDRSYRAILEDDASLREWRRRFAGTLGVQEYYRKYSWRSLPVVLVTAIGRELPWYGRAGIQGFGIYAEPGDWLTYELTRLLAADLWWSGSLEGPERAGRYARERYGAAGPAMLGYLLAVERAGRTLFDRPAGDYGNPRAVEAARAGLL